MAHTHVPHRISRAAPYYVMLLPAVALVLLFAYLPLRGLMLAFQDYSPRLLFRSPSVGLQHFRFLLLEDPFFLRALRNTVLLVPAKTAIGTAAAVSAALILARVRQGSLRSAISTVLLIPMFVSWIVVAAITRELLGAAGPVAEIALAIGVVDRPTNVLAAPQAFPVVLLATDLWKHGGWGALIVLTAILGIDETYYQSAAIDGASEAQQVRLITLPLIAGMVRVLATLTLLTAIDTSVEQVLNLYHPAVYRTGDVLGSHVYRTGLAFGKLDVATAAGIIRAVINIAFMLVLLVAVRMARSNNGD